MLEDQLAVDENTRVSCPVCGSRVTEHASTFDGGLYECRRHGPFGVSRSAEACGYWKKNKQAKAEAFRNAEVRGKQTARAPNDNRPAVLITTYDF